MRLPGALARPILLGCLTAVAGAVALADRGPVRLVGVSARSDPNGQTVFIESTEPVAYVVKRPDPLTVLVDLQDVAVSEAARQALQLAEGPVRAVHVGEVAATGGEAVARVRLDLSTPAPHQVRSARNTIRVEFARTADPVAPVTGAASGDTSARPTSSPGLATTLRSVSTATDGDRTTVTLSGNGRLEAARVLDAQDLPPRVVLDFTGVDTSAPAQTQASGDPVTRVRVARNSQSPLVTRVVVDLSRPTPYRVVRAGAGDQDLAIVFEPGAPAESQAPAPDAPGPTAVTTVASAADPFSALTLDPAALMGEVSSSVSPPSSAPAAGTNPPRSAPTGDAATPTPSGRAGTLARRQAPARSAAGQAAMTAQQESAAQEAQAPKYTGRPINIDMAGADLRSVLRLFTDPDISGLNLVIDPAVQGTVDVVLNQVPWDQALDIILRGSKLGFVVDGTVVRVAPLDVLEQEAAAQKKLAEARALAGDLQVMTKSLSYAKAATLRDLVTRAALSQRGEVQVDERTNTLILRDLQGNLDIAERLLGDLDQPEPQVEIEARVVQTTREFARALGIQWGVSGRSGPELGNTTRWGFPNRGVLDGRTGAIQQPNDTRAGPLERTGTVVNLPVQGASTALGLLLEAVNGSFNLDVALSALERSGRGRILSTPRVTTQNNQEAEVTQGIQIPIQTVANNTVTVSFKDAALTLRVVPQITASSTVIMKITLENASPDFSRQVNNIPPIDTQRAITSVQVTDGATTVIGGIFTSTEQTLNERTPLFYKIPLLGWLFKRDNTTEESRELLIFITPRILRG